MSVNCFTLTVLLAISIAHAGTYYVSSTGGSDTASIQTARNQTTPWKTLAKVNAQTFAAEDNELCRK